MRHFLFHPTDAANDEKNEPRCGMGARWRGSGHGYYFLLRKFFLGSSENLLKNTTHLAPGRAAVKNRHAGTGEVINSSAQGWFPCYPGCHLWHP
jgi:hypothetical protein